MPPKYEDLLSKRIQSYLWNSNSPPAIATSTMAETHQKGGLKLLNLKARNNAIRIMKLRKLADYSPNHPLASDAALKIILTCTQTKAQKDNSDGPTILDFFLQSIINHKHFSSKQLPPNLKAILNTGAKYNITLDSPRFSTEHKMNMPAWFHPGSKKPSRGCESRSPSKCLWKSHQVRLIFDLVVHDSYHKHPDHMETNKNCKCKHCSTTRLNGCTHPHRCFQEATSILSELSPN